MPKSFFVLLSVLVLLAVAAPTAAPPLGSETSLNSFVLQATQSYQGQYPYLLNDDYASYNGVTRDISYQGQTLLRANPNGDRASHCVGITFEVLFAAVQERNRMLGLPADYFNNMLFEDMQDFMMDWYAAKGPKTVSNIGVAAENYGIGRRILDLELAEPGDFIDYMRDSGSGHTAVFLEWVRQEGQIIGFKYWSSQTSTNGIGENIEYFDLKQAAGGQYGNVRQSSLVIVRISDVSDYLPFRTSAWAKLQDWLRNTLLSV